jgi:hypothetical protein
MVAMITGYARTHLRGHYWDLLDDGDDCTLIVESVLLDHVKATLFDYFRALGQELTLGGIAYTAHDLVFCQSKPITLIDGLTFIRDYRKVLSTCFASHKHYHDETGGFRVMLSIALAELSLNRGVPVLQVFFEEWVTKLSHLRPAKLDAYESSAFRANLEWGEAYVLKKSMPITIEARASFELAFHTTVEEQLELEDYLRAIVRNYPLINSFDVGIRHSNAEQEPWDWPVED